MLAPTYLAPLAYVNQSLTTITTKLHVILLGERKVSLCQCHSDIINRNALNSTVNVFLYSYAGVKLQIHLHGTFEP